MDFSVSGPLSVLSYRPIHSILYERVCSLSSGTFKPILSIKAVDINIQDAKRSAHYCSSVEKLLEPETCVLCGDIRIGHLHEKRPMLGVDYY